MKRVSVLISLALAACVAVDDHVSSTTQHYCTQEDIDNGTCQDPGGGSPPADGPISVSSPDAQSSVLQLWNSYAVAARDCSIHTGNGGTGGTITCVTCSGDVMPGCGYHGGGCYYFCRVCVGDTQSDSSMCGLASVMR